MGSRNPNRVDLRWRRSSAETIGEMAAQGWQVISACEACGIMLTVNLKHMIKLSRPTLSLWNEKTQCRRVGCTGFAGFRAMPPGTDWYQALVADDRD